MATARRSKETEFELTILRIRREIERRFHDLVACARERERELLQQLDEICTVHSKASRTKQPYLSELDDWFGPTEAQLDIETRGWEGPHYELGSDELSMEWDDSVVDGISRLGVLSGKCVYESSPVVDSTPVVKCGSKMKLILKFGSWGTRKGQFDRPTGVAADYNSGNIFVADQFNNRVQVFDSEGKYLYKFGDARGNGEMNHPAHIAISNGRVFVSQISAGCLIVYDLTGNFIKRVGSQGGCRLQFNCPYAIAINELNGDIYVCDNNNSRIQILTKTFQYKSKFEVSDPQGIKLTSRHIHVLTPNYPNLFIFNYEFEPVLEKISFSIAKHLITPTAFCIDGAGRFIISDIGKNQILIFQKGGDLITQLDDFGIYHPVSVSVNKKGRVVVGCFDAYLLIY